MMKEYGYILLVKDHKGRSTLLGKGLNELPSRTIYLKERTYPTFSLCREATYRLKKNKRYSYVSIVPLKVEVW